MKILMLVITDVAHDSRVLREATVLASDHLDGGGHDVHVIGKDVPADWTPPAGVTVESVSGGRGLRPDGGGAAGASSSGASGASGSMLKRAARWALLPQHRQRVWRTWRDAAEAAVGDRVFDVVHAHDFNTLPLAERIADRQGALLVYDSHEWWSGRQVHGRPTPIERARELRAERRAVARADAVLTVSDGIARRLGEWRRPGAMPASVVRNTFPARTEFATPLTTRPVSAVYAGRIGPARDLETLLAATASAGLTAHLIGPADREYLAGLRHAPEHVRIDPARPVDEVDEILRADGISVVTLSDTCENHRLALPNKLFHAVRAGVPVLAADLPEMRRLVTEYGLGELYRPGDAASMAAALRRLVDDYPRWCERVAAAAPEFTWARDAAVLSDVYATLAARRPTATAGTA